MINFYYIRRKKESKQKKSKQSKIPKIPIHYNGSKVIPGNHEVKFIPAREIEN